jgi:ribosomal protein S18 acetylase RimI-like enzyme
MNKLSIRKAASEDIETLVNFNISMAKETENINLDESTVHSGVKYLIENPDYGFYLIAENKDGIAGSLMITKEWSDWRDGFFWWIQSVYVKPEFRRKGVYKSLYNFVKELSHKDIKCRGYRLYVEKNNKKAISAYQNLGMEETYYKLFEEMKERAL